VVALTLKSSVGKSDFVLNNSFVLNFPLSTKIRRLTLNEPKTVPNTQDSASNIVTRLLEGFSGLLHGVLILAFDRVLATPVFETNLEQPSLIAWHILGIPPDIIYPLMSQKIVTDRIRIDWMVYSVELY